MSCHPDLSRGRRRLRTGAAALCVLAAVLAAATPSPAGAATTDWNFTVRLDGRPIGAHRFELDSSADGSRTVVSSARFAVKLLGLTVYRYQHSAQERWEGECLNSLSARTDDDGDVTEVTGRRVAGEFKVLARHASNPVHAEVQGCLMSFAYWDPAQLARQQRLLDPGTGRIEAVSVTAMPATTIMVRGMSTAVTGLRISGLKHPIDAWYADGRWVGLDSAADGGRKLTYRLQ